MLPEHSPFTPDQRRILNQILSEISPPQVFWLAGYLSASFPATPLAGPQAAPTSTPLPKLTVLYGTESGNAEKLADQTVKEAKKRGFQATLKNMADLHPKDLTQIENLLVIVSTWGDGDPPETATAFHKALMNEAFDFSKVRYSVCALGDTAYERFCQTGKDIDGRLKNLGATSIFDRQDCDVDYDDAYRAWVNGVFDAFKALLPSASSSLASQGQVPAQWGTSLFPAAPSFDKSNPFKAELLERVLLNGKGSQKETWHYEISLEGSGLSYQPGDALGILPQNADDSIADLLQAAKLTGNEEVTWQQEGKPLAAILREQLEITTLTRPVLAKLQEVTKSKKLATLLSEKKADALKDYLWGRWIADAIRDFAPKGLDAGTLVSLLRKLPPRLYSIASSPLAHPSEVHLTVSSVRYHAHGKNRKGVASTFLADHVQKGDFVPVYVHENKNFRLPESGDTPIIMVGPGTGIAPFRAFVEHRSENGDRGKNWLFFGDQRYNYDFLYQLEWQDHLKNGSLSRLDVAFSRDQPEKVYVQHKILARARELYAWLQEGAHVYVCGDASRMAHDVHEALIQVIESQAGVSRPNAEAYLEDLKKTRRYQRDVY